MGRLAILSSPCSCLAVIRCSTSCRTSAGTAESRTASVLQRDWQFGEKYRGEVRHTRFEVALPPWGRSHVGEKSAHTFRSGLATGRWGLDVRVRGSRGRRRSTSASSPDAAGVAEQALGTYVCADRRPDLAITGK